MLETQDRNATRRMFAPEDAGCWYDSHRGWTINATVIDDAWNAGMLLPADIVEAWDTWNCDAPTSSWHTCWENFWQDRDDFYDIANEAESFLDSLAPEGFYIGWNDGDFGMYPIEEDF